jgi:hypothetical protein
MGSRTLAGVLLIFLFILATLGCVSGSDSWSFTINGNASMAVDSSLYGQLRNDSETYDGVTGIPLEIFLAYYGAYPVTAVSYNGTAYDWKQAAYGADKDIAMLVEPNGSVYYAGATNKPADINVTLTEKPNISTLDVAPSVLYALGAGGKDGLIHNRTSKVLLVYVDALGYMRYEDALGKGLVTNMSSLGEPVKAVCVYPSVTQTNAKAMATGLAPNLTRGDFRSYLPYNDTVLDILGRDGLHAVWVDGGSPPVYVNSALLVLDTDKDGSADDEVADAAVRELKNASLVVAHFTDTDTEMHDHGPYSPEAMAALERDDALVGRMLERTDNDTTVIIYADHGCHTVAKGGNHGTLLPDDMYIPIIVGRA